jgi:hypothetical protein
VVPGVRAVLLPVALVLVLVLTGCEVRAPAGHGPEPSAPTAAAVDRLLATRAAAVLSGSRDSLTATGASDADASVSDLAGRLAGLPVTAWAYGVLSVRFGPWPAAVTVHALLSYRFRTDPATVQPASAEREVVVVADPAAGGAPRVRSERPVGAWLPWDIGAARWSQVGTAAVLDLRGTSADVATDGAIATATARAARAVTAVWGSTMGRAPLVVAVDGTTALAELTGRPLGATGGLVAVTTIDRVYLDAAAWLALSPAGRQALLTHEVTHLATGSAGDDAVPLWLEEGPLSDPSPRIRATRTTACVRSRGFASGTYGSGAGLPSPATLAMIDQRTSTIATGVPPTARYAMRCAPTGQLVPAASAQTAADRG